MDFKRTEKDRREEEIFLQRASPFQSIFVRASPFMSLFLARAFSYLIRARLTEGLKPLSRVYCKVVRKAQLAASMIKISALAEV